MDLLRVTEQPEGQPGESRARAPGYSSTVTAKAKSWSPSGLLVLSYGRLQMLFRDAVASCGSADAEPGPGSLGHPALCPCPGFAASWLWDLEQVHDT